MSLPVSKLSCGIGEAPVTGAWIPITISLSLTPAVSSGPGWYGPCTGWVVCGATVVTDPLPVVGGDGTVLPPGGGAPVGSVARVDGAVEAGGAAVTGGGAGSPLPATTAFCPHATASNAAGTRSATNDRCLIRHPALT